MGKEMIKKSFLRNKFDKLKLLPIKKGFERLRSYSDYRTYGGGIFLGVRKNVVKAHGNSDEKSFYYTLKQAEEYAIFAHFAVDFVFDE